MKLFDHNRPHRVRPALDSLQAHSVRSSEAPPSGILVMAKLRFTLNITQAMRLALEIAKSLRIHVALLPTLGMTVITTLQRNLPRRLLL